jgi:GTP-binding protein Era
VGKSTLLNRLLGQKLAITAHKPQTTRHAILGVRTDGADQYIFVDTPGIHAGGSRALNRVLNRTAGMAVREVDAVILVVQANVWSKDDQKAFDTVIDCGAPIIIAVNKIDKIKRMEEVLPFLSQLPQHADIRAIVPLSARSGKQIGELEKELHALLPENPHIYGEDEITDRSSRFLAAEMIREPLTRLLDKELPYALTVEIEDYKVEGNMHHIHALIWVERPGQKAIVIGKGGEQLKEIGRRARESLEQLFDCRVNLKLWVKIKAGWADDERALRSLGYESE